MSAPTIVSCPQCRSQLDLSALPHVPPQVRCGSCKCVFPTADGSGRQRWKGDPGQSGELSGIDNSSDAVDPADLLPPGAVAAEPTRPASPIKGTSGKTVGSDVDVTPPHLRPTAVAAPSPADDVLPPTTDGLPPLHDASALAQPLPGAVPIAEGAAFPHAAPAEPAAGADPITPPAIAGLAGVNIAVDDGDRPARRHRGGRWGGLWMLAGISGILVIAAGTMVVIYVTNGPLVIRAREDSGPPGSGGTGQRNTSQEIAWTDASRYAAQYGGVRVKVVQFELGDVRARDDENRLRRSDEDRFLQVFVTVENQRRQTIDYVSWYGNIFTVDGSDQVARLTDDDGNEYPMLTFRDAMTIHGHTPQASIRPRQRVRDTIVFELPPDANPETAEYFRLELPAAAFGEVGQVRFEMPSDFLRHVGDASGLLEGLGGSTDDSTETDDSNQ